MPNNVIKITGTGQPTQPEPKVSPRIKQPLERILWKELELSMIRKFLVMLDQQIDPTIEFSIKYQQFAGLVIIDTKTPVSIIQLIKTLPQVEFFSDNICYVGTKTEPHFTVYINS